MATPKICFDKESSRWEKDKCGKKQGNFTVQISAS